MPASWIPKGGKKKKKEKKKKGWAPRRRRTKKRVQEENHVGDTNTSHTKNLFLWWLQSFLVILLFFLAWLQSLHSWSLEGLKSHSTDVVVDDAFIQREPPACPWAWAAEWTQWSPGQCSQPRRIKNQRRLCEGQGGLNHLVPVLWPLNSASQVLLVQATQQPLRCATFAHPVHIIQQDENQIHEKIRQASKLTWLLLVGPVPATFASSSVFLRFSSSFSISFCFSNSSLTSPLGWFADSWSLSEKVSPSNNLVAPSAQ